MTKLTREIKDMVDEQKLCFVATADPRGRVNVSPKSSIVVIDDETLAFADLFSRNTRKNLKANPNVAVAVTDLKRLRGYQIKGKAELLEEGQIYEDVVCYLQTFRMKLPDPQYVVKMKVEEIIEVAFPK